MQKNLIQIIITNSCGRYQLSRKDIPARGNTTIMSCSFFERYLNFLSGAMTRIQRKCSWKFHRQFVKDVQAVLFSPRACLC